MEIHPQSKSIVIIEADHRVYNEKENQEIKEKIYNQDTLSLSETQIGRIKAPDGNWGSCIRVIEP